MHEDQFQVEAVDRTTYAVVRFGGGDGRKTVHMTQSHLEAMRMRDELERAVKRAFDAGFKRSQFLAKRGLHHKEAGL